METTIDEMEGLMTGLNYVTTFGFDELGAAYNLEDLKKLIVAKFPEMQDHLHSIVAVDEDNLWDEIQYALDYRGDYGAGMQLSYQKEEFLAEIQSDFKNRLAPYINTARCIYAYMSCEGLPLYPVFWGFCFIIGNYTNWQIVYGASSD